MKAGCLQAAIVLNCHMFSTIIINMNIIMIIIFHHSTIYYYYWCLALLLPLPSLLVIVISLASTSNVRCLLVLFYILSLVADSNSHLISWHSKQPDKVTCSSLAKNLTGSTFNFNFNFIYYLTKEKYKNGRFTQIALASRGGKRQERIGFHYSLFKDLPGSDKDL